MTLNNLIVGHLVRGNGALLRHKITDTVAPENVRDVWNQLTDMSLATRLNSIEVIKLCYYLFIIFTCTMVYFRKHLELY